MTFQRHLQAMGLELLLNFSKAKVPIALTAFTKAKKIQQKIGNSVSFVTFVSYLLIFNTILNLICGLTSNSSSTKKQLQDLYAIRFFSWSTVWFVVLTLYDSQGSETVHQKHDPRGDFRNFI
ncbi:hypothetical protein TNCT_90651 [Trichonephila clavata]|uniref:Uncharacterized protein n=1 Tax=Trichonephila clavata TaxID=2740835 RepID=A0A8X6JPG6_TRICU|nr:hypothetical protein TNCT_90651 [Trichonephila clavata]